MGVFRGELSFELCEDARPTGFHSLECFLAQGGVEVETFMRERKEGSRIFWCELPRDRGVERTGCKAVFEESFWCDFDDFAGLLAPWAHVEIEPVSYDGLNITHRPPSCMKLGYGQRSPKGRRRMGIEMAQLDGSGFRHFWASSSSTFSRALIRSFQ